MKKLLKISVLVLLVIIACKKENNSPSSPYNGKTTAVFNSSVTYGTLTDQDGNVYKTITIGTQTWMAENLRTTKYNDGTAIPKVTGASSWVNLTTGAYCNVNNTENTDSVATYGRLYNLYAVNTGKLAPSGWHVPADAEWIILRSYLGGLGVAGRKMKEIDTTHWIAPNYGATNESGFTALPSGLRSYSDGTFSYVGSIAFYWSSTINYDPYSQVAMVPTLQNSDITVYGWGEVYMVSGFAVRLVKD